MDTKIDINKFDAYQLFDIFISTMLIIFFLGYLAIHSEIIGLQGSLMPIPNGPEAWDIFGWMLFGAISFDVYLKYRKVSNLKVFLKKHPLDMIMLILWPIFSGLKIAKISIKLVKSLKLSKFGYKAIKASKKLIGKRESNNN
jgi:hypothetical protein